MSSLTKQVMPKQSVDFSLCSTPRSMAARRSARPTAYDDRTGWAGHSVHGQFVWIDLTFDSGA